MNTKFLLDKWDLFFFGHLSVLGDGTSRQRLVKHFHIWMLRQVVKATQVTNETLQLLEELKDKRKHEKNKLLLYKSAHTPDHRRRDTRRGLTSVLPFLTSSKRSNTSARLGSSESTNHIGGVDGYDSCNTGKSTSWKQPNLVGCWWISHKVSSVRSRSQTVETVNQNQRDILGNEMYDRTTGLRMEKLLSRPSSVSLTASHLNWKWGIVVASSCFAADVSRMGPRTSSDLRE